MGATASNGREVAVDDVIGIVLVLMLVFMAWGVYSIVRAPADRRRRLVGWTLAGALLGGVLGFTLT